MNFPEILDFAKQLQDLSAVVVIAAIFIVCCWVWCQYGFGRLMEPFYFWQNRKLEKLNLFLSDQSREGADIEMNKVMHDIRDAMYFKGATGIYAEGKLRNRLMALHKSTSLNVSWRTIKRAMDFLEPDAFSSMKVKEFGWFDHIVFVINMIALAFTAIGFSMTMILISASMYSSRSELLETAAGLFMFLIAMFIMMVSSVLPYVAAKRVRKDLIKSGQTKMHKSLPAEQMEVD